MKLKVNGQVMIPGNDFLIDPASPSIRGKYDVLTIRLDTLLRNTSEWVKFIKSTKQVICLDKTGYDQLLREDRAVVDGLVEVLKFNKEIQIPAVLVLSDDKLTWGVSQHQSMRPVYVIKSDQLSSREISEVRINLKSEFVTESFSQNVIGLLKGEIDSAVLITAHYDHLGRMGRNTYFPGANDNGSGTAMMLNLAREFSFFGKPKYDLVFVAFGGEEAGLIGSQYYVSRPLYPLHKTKFVINLDMVGTGEEGIMVVNGKTYPSRYNHLLEINNKNQFVKEIQARGVACNSDHCSFDQVDVPAFYIYTLGGIAAYHDTIDRAETLPLTAYEGLFKLLQQFIQQ